MRPITDYKDPISGAFSEITSAMSSLNCEPCPLITVSRSGNGLLSETDYWVEHAMAHLHQASEYIMRIREAKDR